MHLHFFCMKGNKWYIFLINSHGSKNNNALRSMLLSIIDISKSVIIPPNKFQFVRLVYGEYFIFCICKTCGLIFPKWH